MQCWAPALRSGTAVLYVLLIVVAAVLQGQQGAAFDEGFHEDPFEWPSTFDADILSQNSQPQKTVGDFIRGGILKESKQPKQSNQPKFRAPQQLKRSQPVKVPSPSAKQTPAAKSKTGKSPLREWVKPQAGSKEVSKDQSAAKKATVPQVARRSSRSAQRQQARNAKKVPSKQEQPASPAIESYPAPQEDVIATDQTARDLPPLTPSQINLRKKVRKVLTHYYNRPLNTRDRSPWELMHAMLAFEARSKVLQGGPNGKPITAVGWLCFNQACKRRTLMYVNDDGDLQVRVGPALQGHRGQLLAMLAQSRINKNYPMLVEGHELKIADLIEMEKRTCYPRTELTFKLIGLMHYLDSDATWVNDQGMEWNFSRMISEELRQPIRGAACGGTHRLGGLTLAYKTREKRGEPVDGQYLKAKQFVTRYQNYAYRLQNRDGSFSTEWFRGPGNEESIDRKLKTTGHILEWLLYASTEKELRHWRTTKAVNYLSNIMLRNRYKDWEAGPLGHAIHALLVYDRLAFGPYDKVEAKQPVAAKSSIRRQR